MIVAELEVIPPSRLIHLIRNGLGDKIELYAQAQYDLLRDCALLVYSTEGVEVPAVNRYAFIDVAFYSCCRLTFCRWGRSNSLNVL